VRAASEGLSRKELLLNSFKLGKIDKDLFGPTPPSAFVGRFGYPEVLAGPLVSPAGEEVSLSDTPDKWLYLSREEIIGFRSNLVRSNFKLNVKDARDPGRLLKETQELAMAALPVDVEVKFLKPPRRAIQFDGILTPMGPSGTVTDIEIVENPQVPKKVDALADDRDIKATEAAILLYEASISPYQISRLLSVGTLGKKRLIVPTRWSITATDSMLGDNLLKRVRNYPENADIQLFVSEAYGNHFEILLVPRAYAFGWTEMWISQKGKIETGDLYEDAMNKPAYMDGGYYAARFSALEFLERVRRQASIYVMREVKPTYDIPLGSWVIRELVKDAFSRKPLIFGSVTDALKSVRTRINVPPNTLFLKKHVLQTRLMQFN
jgi:DNA repair protein NreA